MKRKHRILKNSEILHIIKKGKIFRTSHLSIYFSKNLVNNFRVTVCISKKVAKLAVIRNKIKRRINAIVTQDYDKNKHFDIIIVCKLGVDNITYQLLSKELNVFLKHLASQKGGHGE